VIFRARKKLFSFVFMSAVTQQDQKTIFRWPGQKNPPSLFAKKNFLSDLLEKKISRAQRAILAKERKKKSKARNEKKSKLQRKKPIHKTPSPFCSAYRIANHHQQHQSKANKRLYWWDVLGWCAIERREQRTTMIKKNNRPLSRSKKILQSSLTKKKNPLGPFGKKKISISSPSW